jgi:hypothetical protein
MEYWNVGQQIEPTKPFIPSFHYSNIPIYGLCALRLLFVHPPLFNPRGSKGKEESPSIQGSGFFVFTQKRLCDLGVLCGSFFLPPRRAQRLL